MERFDKFKRFHQFDGMDCGATCLKMVANFYGANYDVAYLRDLVDTSRQGASIAGICNAANAIKLKTLVSTGTVETLVNEHLLPAILYWNPDHYVVLYKIKSTVKKGKVVNEFFIADPAFAKFKCTEQEFHKRWVSANADSKGIIVFFEPEEDFGDTFKGYRRDYVAPAKHFYWQYFDFHKKSFLTIVAITVLSSLLNLSFPILTQKIVDFGIPKKDLSFISLILTFQIVAFLGSSVLEFIKSKLLFTVTTRLNIDILTKFLLKLTKLSIRYFDNKMVSDITQRIADHTRIERFLTGNIISTLFSIFNFSLFAVLILKYDYKIFLIFLAVTAFSMIWMATFVGKRKAIEYKRFEAYKNSSNSVYEVVYGMKELKLNNAQVAKVEDWRKDQNVIHDITKTSLLLEQKQTIGNVLINQVRSAVITFYCAYLVINHQISLGEMISISYMLGQLASPFTQFFEFVRGWNEAIFSFERINEVNERKDEDQENLPKDSILRPISNFQCIQIDNMSFSYDRLTPKYVLQDVNITITKGQKVAFVGNSGSGKTTLLKMLLKFYTPVFGDILIDDHPLSEVIADDWRNLCGAVLQDGYIFSSSILKNIALNSKELDLKRVKEACRLANIDSFIETLPKKYETTIGGSGTGLSGGQSQRILIARALYKNPQILFFDEATSSLDTENERIIMNNITELYKDKTLVVIAHRLSTVKNADVIYVFDNGRIVEAGNHEQLLEKKGHYLRLVSNQLELSK
ncbi:peptidase domain-containing ABC transporter [Mucilaginibacter sp. BJC16-A38]|uniref:peptidase domain-containing ABC transporter n=1 Tax=Mucilaginibacter phenanthrenivorans TaxID=1234842 RepID=UPI002157381D|nr:peptidase domain-containing ABC transporter [Mucilaginibacter phenanthrenivorans]MCR8559310.1 peptidase domain-containing ABC transporter [Mucilaginibacter phenanthrenivorans]